MYLNVHSIAVTNLTTHSAANEMCQGFLKQRFAVQMALCPDNAISQLLEYKSA